VRARGGGESAACQERDRRRAKGDLPPFMEELPQSSPAAPHVVTRTRSATP
jgi:hypothetical protein